MFDQFRHCFEVQVISIYENRCYDYDCDSYSCFYKCETYQFFGESFNVINFLGNPSTCLFLSSISTITGTATYRSLTVFMIGMMSSQLQLGVQKLLRYIILEAVIM